MTKLHFGGCVCGAVRFQVDGAPTRVTICHCKWCQRRTGSAFAVEPVFGIDQVRILQGEFTRYRHISDESGRWLELESCPVCCSTIGFTLEAVPDIRTLGVGTFDDPTWISSKDLLSRHVFVRSALDWSNIPDDVDQFETHFRP